MSLNKEIYDFIFDDLAARLKKPEVIYTLKSKTTKFEALPCGIDSIDEMLSGGLPEGKIIEIFGPEQSGKTTLTLTFIRSAQQLGYMVYFIDAEHALDVEYAQRIGVDMESLLLSQPEFGEQALETIRSICDTMLSASEKFGRKVKSLIVTDSIPALVPKAVYETLESDKKDGFESSTSMATTARMLSSTLPPLLSKLSSCGATAVFINQERDNVGVMYGPPTTTPGGRALKYFSSLRIKVQKCGVVKNGDEIVGIRSAITPVKSKQFAIFNKKVEVTINEKGIDQIPDQVESAITKGIITKGGAWLTFDGQRYQGMQNFVELLRTDKALYKKLVDSFKPKLNKPLVSPNSAPPSAPPNTAPKPPDQAPPPPPVAPPTPAPLPPPPPATPVIQATQPTPVATTTSIPLGMQPIKVNIPQKPQQ